MKTRFFSILTVSVLFLNLLLLSSAVAQDETWSLPEGATTRLGKGKITGEIAHSPDGSLIAVPSLSNIWIYNASTGAEVKVLTGHAGSVTSVAFNGSGKLASGSSDARVFLWDISTGAHLQTLFLQSHVVSVAYAGNTVAAGSRNGKIRLWNPSTNATTEISGHSGSVVSLALSPDGSQLASGGADNTIVLWDVNQNGSLLWTLIGHTGTVEDLTYNSAGDRLASAGYDKTVRVWNTATGSRLLNLTGHTKPVSSVSFQAGSSILASGSYDHTIRLWNVSATWNISNPEHIGTLTGHTAGVTSVSFQPTAGSNTLVSAGVDTTLRWWNVSSRANTSTIEPHTAPLTSVAFAPGGNNKIATGDANGNIHLWTLRVDASKRTLTGHTRGVKDIAFSPDGTMLASVGGYDGTVRLWDANTGAAKRTINVPGSGFTSEFVLRVAFSSDSRTVATGSYDGSIHLWNATTGALLHKFTNHTSGVTDLDFHPTEDKLISGGADSTIRLWDTSAYQLLRTHRETNGPGIYYGVSFLRSGNVFISGSSAGLLGFWSTGSNTPPRNVRTLARLGSIYAVAATHDPNRMWCTAHSRSNDLQVWTNVTRRPNIRAFSGHKGTIRKIAISQDDSTVATASEDGTVLLWATSSIGAAPQLTSLFSEEPVSLNTAPVVTATALLANYPNPFNPETWIPYQLASPADVRISIYSAEGILVRTLDLGVQDVGVYQSRARAAYWDGRNQAGEPVASGVYFYTLTAGEFTATRKMLILK